MDKPLVLRALSAALLTGVLMTAMESGTTEACWKCNGTEDDPCADGYASGYVNCTKHAAGQCAVSGVCRSA